jgi:alkylation response protein AidB-like acyl-CoA dehydrogenase
MVTETSPNDNDCEARERYVPWARELGQLCAQYSIGHDRDGTFVAEAFGHLKSSGYLSLPVPRELGGSGATVAQVTMAQAELGRHCSATALASSMHLHTVATQAHRWRKGHAAVEPLLRQVASDGIVVVSTGGTDGPRPTGTARRVDGGWRVSGRKTLASQAPAGDILATWFPVDEADGRVVLGMAIPLGATGVNVLDTWDALGMRGTGSHDIVLEDVFVADAQVTAKRAYNELDPALRLMYVNAMTIVAGAYWGIAQQAADLAVLAKASMARPIDAAACHIAGAMRAKCATIRWAMRGLLNDLGDGPDGSIDELVAVMTAKRIVATDGLEVADLAMELVGGASFLKSQPLEQCWRDLRAAKFHPWTPETTLQQIGRISLGLAPEAY